MTEFKKKVTQSLFYEAAKPHLRENALWTLSEQDKELNGKFYPSAYRIYMSSNDEYEAAMEICDGDLRVWEKLCRTKWFMDGKPVWGHHGLLQWRKDMAARDASLARKTLREEAEAGNVAAARAILADQKENKRPEKPKAKDPLEAIRKHLEQKKSLEVVKGGKS